MDAMHLDFAMGRTYRVQVADALLQETRNNSGVPRGLVIGLLILLFFVNDHPSVIPVVKLLFPMTTRRSHHTKKGVSATIILCRWKYGRLNTSRNVIKDLAVIVGSSLSLFIHCREPASKEIRLLFMIRQLFSELSVSASVAFLKMSRKDTETDSTLLLEPPLPPIYSKTNLIRRGRNGLQRSRD